VIEITACAGGPAYKRVIGHAETNPRKSCNGKPIEGMRLLYTPNDNAQGDDRIIIEIVNSSGQNLKYTYDITVK
jgi:hypothetical protein